MLRLAKPDQTHRDPRRLFPMLRLARAPLALLASAALGGCASDSPGAEETNLTGGAVDEGSPASGGLDSNPTAGSASGGDSSQSSAPTGSGMSAGLPSNGAGSELPGGAPPAGGEPTPGGDASEGMSGEVMSDEGVESPVDDPSPSGEAVSDAPNAGNPMGDSSEADGNGDGSPPTPDEGASMDGTPPVEEQPDVGGGNDEPVDDEPANDEPVTFATCPDTTWKLVWGDDFDGPAGSAVDGGKWAYDSGPNWYNGELQNYTTGTDNAFLDGAGNLVIEARREDREGRQYTSARLKTEGKHTFTYGRFEGRMKLPYGQGMWPALWMLGGTSWPNDGEIDIMENLGREPSIAHGTIHGPGYSGADGPGAPFTLPNGEVFSDDFHIFAVEWEPDVIRWYIDGEHYSTKTPADIGGNRWVFDHPFFFIVNLAVGGEWPGNPDQTTVFPQQFLIDYIRVCQK